MSQGPHTYRVSQGAIAAFFLYMSIMEKMEKLQKTDSLKLFKFSSLKFNSNISSVSKKLIFIVSSQIMRFKYKLLGDTDTL